MRRSWVAILVVVWSVGVLAQHFPDRQVHQQSIESVINSPWSLNRSSKPSASAPTTNEASVYAPELAVPENARASYLRGLQYLREDNAGKAEAEFRRATELFPRYSSAFNGLGVALRYEGEVEQARAALEQALQINPNNAAAQKNLAGLLLSEGRPTDAEKLLQSATVLQPSEPEGFVMLAYVELALKHYDASIAAANAIGRQAWKRYPVVRAIRARALEMSGHGKEAVAEYEAYLKTRPDDAHAKMAREAIRQLKSKN